MSTFNFYLRSCLCSILLMLILKKEGPAQIHLVKDLETYPLGGGDWFSEGNSAVIGPYLYFTGKTSTLGTELWRTDGTAGGTTLVKDINPGPNNGDPSYF